MKPPRVSSGPQVRPELLRAPEAPVPEGKLEADGPVPQRGVGRSVVDSLAEIKALGDGRAAKERRVRVRFAPSPTGPLHIASAMIALQNYLFAKQAGGEFVLRVEDTDQQRSRPEFTKGILDTLKWLGLEWKGEVVYQSQRAKLYDQAVEKLLASGAAYKDGDGNVLFRMPAQGLLSVHDGVKGKVDFQADEIKDFVIRGRTGEHLFLLANVVDDGESGITHVIRGEDHLGNAAKQVCLFRALGYEPPKFYHLPLLLGDDNKKLSKRHGATSMMAYRDMGYTPQVLLNHLARTVMSYDTDQTLSLDGLAQRFDAARFQSGATHIGLDKLLRRGRQELAGTPVLELSQRFTGLFPGVAKELTEPQLLALLEGARGRADTLEQVKRMADFLAAAPSWELPPAPADEAPAEERRLYERTAGAAAAARAPENQPLFAALRGALAALPAEEWNAVSLKGTLARTLAGAQRGHPEVANALDFMLTGVADSMPLELLLAFIGRERSLERLTAFAG